MKVSRLLTAVLAVAAIACADDPDRVTEEQPYQSDSPPAVATAGEATGESPAPPPPATPVKAAVSTPVADQARVAGVNADAAVLADFKARVEKYIALRKDAVKGAPKLKETEDVAQIKAAQDALSARIRAARTTARHGDVFTPEITVKIRQLLSPELKGDDGRDAKAILKDDAPTNVPLEVNAKYPDGAPVPTVPASLLLNLPTLPEPLQYRIIGRHLILLDEDADVIVDYAVNVIR